MTNDAAGVPADPPDPAVVLAGTDWDALVHGMGPAGDAPQLLAELQWFRILFGTVLTARFAPSEAVVFPGLRTVYPLVRHGVGGLGEW
ncbi:hypothetical protein ACFVYD_34675 [Streptomyces sp. NPDC058301]|uniref:hypothetical protein n=1 Tax=Streptomyces sp. NPDC058301 TaxID=3346436 RepID=UPI0036ECB553